MLELHMETKPERPLPKGWVLRTSKSRRDRNYYFNTASGMSSWKHPLDISNKSDSTSPKKKLRRSRDSADSSSVTSGDLPAKCLKPLLSPVSPASQHTSITIKSIKSKKSAVVAPTCISKSTDQVKADEESVQPVSKNTDEEKVDKESVHINGGEDFSKPESKPRPLPEQFKCSRERASNIALWVDRVNSSYEPSEQGSISAASTNDGRISLKSRTLSTKYQQEPLTKKIKKKRKQRRQRSPTKDPSVTEGSKSEKYKLSKLGSKTETSVGSKATKEIQEPSKKPETQPKVTKTNNRPPLKKVIQRNKSANSTPLSPTRATGFPSTFTKHLFTPFGQYAREQEGRVESQSVATPMNIDRNSQKFSTPFKSPPLSGPQEPLSSPIDMNPFSSRNETPNQVTLDNLQSFKPDASEGACVNISTEILNLEEVRGNSQRDSGFDEVIDMEVDNYEEMTHLIKAELQEVRSEFQFDAQKVQQEKCFKSPGSYSEDGLHIILDTNVLLSHLKFISELKDVPVEGVGRPILVVPWIVMQELDSLKSDSWRARPGKSVNQDKDGSVGVDTLARQAIRFLHTCFESKHPRIRGETVDEASEQLNTLLDETNDDRILHCCLIVKRKVSHGESVLFSNDQNLCNKAMINGVKAFNHQNLVNGLKELAQAAHPNTITLQADYFKEYYQQLELQEKLAQKRAKADDILCELKCIMREGLAVGVEAEMRSAYEDIWGTIVYIKPPWTLMDLLQILNKHWIAVFGEVLRRSLQATVKELLKLLDPQKGVPGCISNVSQILEHARRLVDAFALHSSYNGTMTKCVAAIQVLQQKCKESNTDHLASLTLPGHTNTIEGFARVPQALSYIEPSTPTPSSYVNESTPPNSDETASVASVSVQGEINSTVSKHPHTPILSTFEVIWSAVTQFSAQIFSALSYPNSIPASVIENLLKPTKNEAISFLGHLCRSLSALVTALHNVLRVPIEGLSGEPQSLEKLVFSIRSFMKEILGQDSQVSIEGLYHFCQDSNTRSALVQGVSQLDRALAMLQHCASCIV